MAASFTATTQEMAEVLRTSDSTIRRLRREGVLKAGTHYRAIGSGTIRPALLWNVEAVEAALAHRSRKELR